MPLESEIPTLKLDVRWDPQTQEVDLRFNSQEFRSWNFVVAVLDQAKAKAEMILRQQQTAAMMAQMQAPPILSPKHLRG